MWCLQQGEELYLECKIKKKRVMNRRNIVFFLISGIKILILYIIAVFTFFFPILPITLLHTFLCSFIIQTNLELGIIVIINYVHCIIIVETWPVLNNWAPKLVPLYILHIPQLHQSNLSSMIRILQFAFFQNKV